MSEEKVLDFGPFKNLIGTWEGNKGMDIAPDKEEGEEYNPYYETIKIEEVGDVKNADSQTLVIVRYLQTVQRVSNNEVFHNETGYWIWDIDKNTIMLSFSIPRGVCVLAGGSFENVKDDKVKLKVSSKLNDPDWGIVQSPFMQNNAKTVEFHREFTFSGDKLKYSQETVVEIYGKTFKHTDENQLVKVK